MTRLALVLGLCWGCGKGPDESGGPTAGGAAGTVTGSGTSAGTPSGSRAGTPAGTPGERFTPTHYRVAIGWFGVVGNQAAPLDDVDLFGSPLVFPIQINVRLGDESIQTTVTPNNHCDVVLTSEATLGQASWAGEAGGWFSLEMPSEASIEAGNCADLDLEATWADPAAIVGAHRWGLTLRDLTDDDRQAWSSTTGDPRLVGSSWWTSAASGSVGGGVHEAPGAATTFQVDDQGAIVRDPDHNMIELDPTLVPQPGGVADGFYWVFPLGTWRDANELL